MTSCTCEPPPSTNTAPKAPKSHVDSIRELLGPALLVRCRWGEKRCLENWSSYTLDRMEDPKYLARLLQGNIGVVLGEVSGGLCTIDIDVDEDVAAFLALNPQFKKTLMSKGKRGCNIWFRLRGKLPASAVIRRSGKKWGECRANGNQTILYGQHPDGVRYTWPQRHRVIEIDSFEEIKWLGGTTMGRVKLTAKETHEADAVQATHANHEANAAHVADAANATYAADAVEAVKVVTTATRSVPSSLPPFPPEKVAETLPTEKETNHQRLFELARQVFTFEKQHEGKYSPAELSGIFNEWYARAPKEFLREAKADYYTEFMNAYKSVKVAIGEAVFERAWENAQRAAAPPEVMAMFGEFPEIQQLACLCRELQREFGTEPFFLSCRTVGQLFGVSPKTAWKRLICLEKCGFVKTVEKGKIARLTGENGSAGYLASRFKYLLPLD